MSFCGCERRRINDGIMRFLEQASDLPFAVRKLGLSATVGLVRTHLEEYGSKNRRTSESFGSCSTIRAA
jgi:hypothetical protein